MDDIRLSQTVSQTGLAASIDARLTASDVASVAVAYIRQNGQFRQINQDPSYRGSDVFQLGSNLRLDRFLPPSFGLAVPVTVNYARTGINPELLSHTDLRADELPGLRRPESYSATYSISIRRDVVGRSWLTRGFLDPLGISASHTQGRNTTDLSNAEQTGYNVTATYLLQLRRHGIRLPFGSIVRGLPRWAREGDAGKGLDRADLSLAPTRIRLSSGLSRDQSNSTAFRVPIARADDQQFRPTLALTHLWQNTAGLTWQPLGMLNLSGDLTSTRDLRVYPDSSTLGRVAYSERRFLLGVPVGVERDRTLITALALTPRLASWLRPRLISTSSFLLSRTLSSRDPIRAFGDSGAFILPQTLNNSRANELGASVDFARGLRQLLGDSSGIGRLLGKVRPVDMSTRLTRTSTFDLTAFDASVGYQLGFGGLDRFLSQEGTSSIGASESRVSTIAGGADLPFGVTMTLSHALTRTTRFQRVSTGFVQTETSQREWPIGNVRWTRTFRKGTITLLALGTSFRHREGSTVQANVAGTPALSAINSSSITPDLQLAFRNGMTMTAGLNSLKQRNASNGNETRLDQRDMTGTFNYAFRLPRSISRGRKQVRSSLTALSTTATTCLQQTSLPDCTVVSDVTRQEFRGGLDTDLLQTLTGGLQLGYSVNDARHLSRRTTQISVIASFQLSLFAGDYR